MCNEPTILSLEDNISQLKKKYGDGWKKDKAAMMILIWASSIYIDDHFEEIWEKYGLSFKEEAKEYREKKTIHGNRLPDDFDLLALSIFEIDDKTT